MKIPERGSYQGQDQFVIDALVEKRGGFFLDSGASNGVNGSNTLRLERDFDWRGICIEPNDLLFAELINNRRSLCLNCCLWKTEGVVDFLEAAGVYGGIVDAYQDGFRQFAERQAAGTDELPVRLEPLRKRARTISSILAEYGAPRVIDYWSLDTEGSEFEILQSFPFGDYRIRVLTVEHNYCMVREQIASFLAAHGMQHVADLGIDDVYVWSQLSARNAWRSRSWRRP